MRYLKDSGQLFRVKLTTKAFDNGERVVPESITYFGPYGKVGAARAQASRLKREEDYNRDSWRRWRPESNRPERVYEVEEGNVIWGPVRDGSDALEHPDGPGTGTVLVDASELEALRTSAAVLDRLNAAGVDNWEGYGDALRGSWDD